LINYLLKGVVLKKNFIKLIVLTALIGFLAKASGFSTQQSWVLSVFSMSIIGTLFFWEMRLSFVFIGSGIFFLMKAIDMENFLKFASLEVVLFLIGMMIIVGMMKEAGLFAWLITVVLRVKNLTGLKMYVIIMLASFLFSGLMGEVTSTMILTMVILNICDFLDVDPLPFVISSVMATNIGSAATVLGNPVGILIAARSGLSFEDFMSHSFTLSLFILFVCTFILALIYKDYLKDLTKKMVPFQEDKSFIYLISVPPDLRGKISMVVFAVIITAIAMHKRIEHLLGLEHNVLLIMIPIIFAGLILLVRHDKAREYIEKEIEWPSVLFFMFLFAQAGVIKASGVADFIAKKIITVVGNYPQVLAGAVLFLSGFLSSVLDNVVTVASFVPIVQSMDSLNMNLKPLWWALLFGACYGGNITMIGSTANIVALGLLEKERNIKITFIFWLKIGLIVGFISMVIAYLAILIIPNYKL